MALPLGARFEYLFILLILSFLGSGFAQDFREAPLLAERVTAGQLPEVTARLPATPLVVEPVEAIGTYGGTIRVTHIQTDQFEDAFNVGGKEAMLRFNRDDGRTIEPNLAESWELSDDARRVTLTLREGLKWSDGEPFTTEDIMFWYEDVLLNEELTPTPPTLWSPGGELMTVTQVDERTVTLEFAVPYAAAEVALAAWATENNFFLPKHYLSPFHPTYASEEELAARVAEAGFSEWFELFGAKQNVTYQNGVQNPDAPVIRAFVPVSASQERVTLERNPYYWKVDTEGNQLPYADQIQLDLVQDLEVYTLRATSGEVDLAQFNLTIDNMPVYLESAERSGYRVLEYDLAWPSMAQYFINMTHKDPARRQLFGEQRFREALSVAINRQEINDLLFFGLGKPLQSVVLPENSPLSNPEAGTLYTEYDVARANALLDELGLERSGPFRTFPDGQPLQLTILFWPGEGGVAKRKTTELVQTYWEAVGIDTNVREVDRTLLDTRRESGDFDVTLWHTGQMTDPLWILNPWHTVPMSFESSFAPAWASWYQTGGAEGSEPPPEAKRVLELWEITKQSGDQEEVAAAAREIQQIHAENVWSVSTIGSVPAPVIVTNRLRNVPETGTLAFDWVYLARYNPEQFFISE